MARLAIGKGFLTEYGKLDKDTQCAVDAAIAKFARHPHPGAHLEKPQHGWDDRIRTLEIDGHWRGIVLAPAAGDTYCLVTVLPSEQAQAYAASHRFSVNPALGVLEVRDEEAIQRMRLLLEDASRQGGRRLFADVSDADLARLGIDQEILPAVRLMTSETDLEARESALPEAQYEVLHALACGMTLDEAAARVGRLYSTDTPPARVDPEDLVTAMERSPGQVTFVSGHEDLQRILAHPFATWRMFLHPSQRKIAYRTSYSGPAQVTGGPGTGKTVTLLHRAAYLASRVAGPVGTPGADGRRRRDLGANEVLVTTFNGTLADALGTQLDLLIKDDGARGLIEVLNVDRLAYRIVKEARGAPVIADERLLRAYWAKAAAEEELEFTPAFLKNEWEQVILAQDLRTERAYLTCLRTGRGRPLTKVQRSGVWQAAQRVIAELAAARQCTHFQLANEATRLLRQAGAPRYQHILVDEAQDLHPAQWRLLRAAVAPGPDDLFIVADPHQRIYDNRVSLASMRINVRGRTHRLSLSYRTTQEVLSWAVSLLGTDPVTGLDGEVDSLLGYRSPMHGPHPRVRAAATRAEEFAQLAKQMRSWLASGIEPQAIGVTARSASLVREAREALKADGLTTIPLSARSGVQAIRAGTMHAMKGLEFQAVAVIGVEHGMVPEPATLTPEHEDPVAYGQDLQRERCVLFVACTRARDHLYVSGTGEPSPFLPPGETDPSSQENGAASAHPAGPPRFQTRSAKVSMRELLWSREDSWRPRLRSVSLVAEADIDPGRAAQIAVVLGRLYAALPDALAEGEPLLTRWPACLAAAMTSAAAADPGTGTYWQALWEATGFPGTAQDEEVWGRAFGTAITRLGMATFPGLPAGDAGPVLMHVGIPAYHVGDFCRVLVAAYSADPELDADRLLAWSAAPDRAAGTPEIGEPARRFLLHGGDYAKDMVDRALGLLGRLTKEEPDLRSVGLPAAMIEAAQDELAAGRLDLSPLTAAPRRAGGDPAAGGRQDRPRLVLDPHGQGVHVLLPAVSDMPAGVARWRITADGDANAVPSPAMWVGAAGTTPQTACPLDKPARTVSVSLAGRDGLAADLPVIDEDDPVLFFDGDGRRLGGTAALPRGPVWIIHPADRPVEFIGQAGQAGEPAAGVCWEGWRLRHVSLENVQAVALRGSRAHAVEARSRPRLDFAEPLPGVTARCGSPVHAVLPALHLPQSLGTTVRWHVEVRRPGVTAPLVARVCGPAEEIDIWRDVPRPALGAFEITVRGPLGRGLHRTVFVAEGLAADYHPPVRPLTVAGLAPGTARLTAAAGATAAPSALRFGPGERVHAVQYRTAAESAQFSVTPPHVSVLCRGAGVTSWTTSQIHLVTEDFAKAGRLLARVPASSWHDQGPPALSVLVRGQRAQVIEAGGHEPPGLAWFDLTLATDTVAAHGRADLAVEVGGVLMPVGSVRPRRLAPGVELLVVRDTTEPDRFSPTYR